ncbi:MAG: YihY/virulence factor BrkB family protein [Acidobacteriota bacterium]|nr:YihY/virulence factor BrkB family protein [Acidobacteriota bacterium]
MSTPRVSEQNAAAAAATAPAAAPDRLRGLRDNYAAVSRLLRLTVENVLDHDCLNLAQSTAYSAIVALFPALIVAAAVIDLLPDSAPLRFQLALFFDRVLPPGVSPLLYAYFQNTPGNIHSLRALVSAGVVSFLGASNVAVTLMEGLRRARNLPPDCWTFWQRRRRAFELVPLSLLPLTVASLLVVFGHAATMWIASHLGSDIRPWVYGLALLVRWSVALGASVGLTALVYHLGTPERRLGVGRRQAVYVEQNGEQHSILMPGNWVPVLPGAAVATAMWLLTTLAFGWYVTRFANYSQVYGSLGVGIALLFWLYIISLSVLCGAEFNTQFEAHFGKAPQPGAQPDVPPGAEPDATPAQPHAAPAAASPKRG